MSEMSRDELLKAETVGSEQGWVAPLTHDKKPRRTYQLRTMLVDKDAWQLFSRYLSEEG